MDGDAGWAALSDPTFDPSREVILPDGDAEPPGLFDGRLHVLDRKPDRLSFEVEGDRPAYLVMVDAYDAGWRARVDGRPTRVLRANVGSGRCFITGRSVMFSGLMCSASPNFIASISRLSNRS